MQPVIMSGGDAGAVDEIVVVPVVHARADDDHAAPAALLRRLPPLPREADDVVGGDAGELLLPGGGEGLRRVVVIGGPFAVRARAEVALHAVLREEQVERGRDEALARSRLNTARGDRRASRGARDPAR